MPRRSNYNADFKLQVHQYICRMFNGRSFYIRDDKTRVIIGFDDACHLLPFSRNPVRLLPNTPEVRINVTSIPK
jgi:hypothetical protein